MTEPIYFIIRKQKSFDDDENSKIAEKFNTKISELNYKVDLLKKYASNVKVKSFSEKLETLFLDSIEKLYEEDSIGFLKLSHIIGNIEKDSNNTIYFYTKNERVKNIQAFITYDIHFMDDLAKQDPFIYIHTFAINTSIPLDKRRVSGSNLFTWFYKNAMRVGFVCIKINAISSIDFWRNKSRFVYITDNMSEIKKKRLEALDELFEQRKIIQTTTGNEEELRKIERDITKIYVGEVPMKRTKSQNSSDSSANSPESISYSIVSPKKMVAQLDKQYPNPPTRAKSATRKRTQQTSNSISRRRTKSFPT